MDDFEFADAGAVVTGAGSGIGRSIALELARRGARVMVADINVESAERVAGEISEANGTAIARQLDVTDFDSVRAAADEAFDAFGEVRVLANNAGVTWRPFRALWDATASDIRWMMEVNYFGVVNGILAFLPRMRELPGRKHMVNTSSFATLSTTPGHAPYTAAKHAVDGISDVLRDELEDHQADFGVTVLYPGLIQTNIGVTSASVRQQQTDEDLAGSVTPYVQIRDFDHREHQQPKSPDAVGWQVAEAIIHNDPYCTTHPVNRGELQTRMDAWLAGYRGR